MCVLCAIGIHLCVCVCVCVCVYMCTCACMCVCLALDKVAERTVFCHPAAKKSRSQQKRQSKNFETRQNTFLQFTQHTQADRQRETERERERERKRETGICAHMHMHASTMASLKRN
jgi:hypothetical protein